jgi:hypothetical protein
MPVATLCRYNTPRALQMQRNNVRKYEALRREAEHKTSHHGVCDVFRHRTIHVDAYTRS